MVKADRERAESASPLLGVPGKQGGSTNWRSVAWFGVRIAAFWTSGFQGARGRDRHGTKLERAQFRCCCAEVDLTGEMRHRNHARASGQNGVVARSVRCLWRTAKGRKTQSNGLLARYRRAQAHGDDQPATRQSHGRFRVRTSQGGVSALEVMLARRKMRSKELAALIGISEQNLSLLESGKVQGRRFSTMLQPGETRIDSVVMIGIRPA